MPKMTETAGPTSLGEPGRGTPQAHSAGAAGAAFGKVTAVKDGAVVFAPAGTNYALQLACPGYAGAVGSPVTGMVRVTARKVWTVPSGGNFISPIFGTPRIVQGRVRALGADHMVVHGGCPVWVDLPDNDIVYDMANGQIRIGSIVNVTALPGARFEVTRAESVVGMQNDE